MNQLSSKLDTPQRRCLSIGIAALLLPPQSRSGNSINPLPAGPITLPSEIVKFFGAKEIILAIPPALRARVMQPLFSKSSLASLSKMDPANLGYMLDFAIADDHPDLTPSHVCLEVTPDGFAQYLPPTKVWELLQLKPWTENDNDPRSRRAMEELLHSVVSEKLLGEDTFDRIVEIIEPEELVTDRVPVQKRRIIARLLWALAHKADGKKMAGEAVLDAMPIHDMVEYIPLHILWKILVEVAKMAQWDGKETPSNASATEEPTPIRVPPTPPALPEEPAPLPPIEISLDAEEEGPGEPVTESSDNKESSSSKGPSASGKNRPPAPPKKATAKQ